VDKLSSLKILPIFLIALKAMPKDIATFPRRAKDSDNEIV